MRRLVAIVATLAILAVGGHALWTYLQPSQGEGPPATVPVSRGTVETTVLASGALQANRVTSVGAEVSGTIKSLNAALGAVVQAGDVIAEIDSLAQQNAVKSAEASLANMNAQKRAQQAQVTRLRVARDRAEQLKERTLLSEADYMTAVTDLEAAEAQIAALDAQISQATLTVDNAKLDLSRTAIVAPVSGTVVAVLVTEGQSVNAVQTSPTIVKIADLGRMIIKAQISEADVTRVRPGQSAYFTILGEPATRIEAELTAIEPAPDAIADQDSGIASSDSAIYYNGLFSVDNSDGRLRIAMTAQVTIVIDQAVDVLTLPAGALGRAGPGGRRMVQVYDPATGETHPQPVEIGLNNNITAEITAGLSEGDLVVASEAGARPASTAGRGGAPMGGLPPMMGGGRPGGPR